jgi:hypothetical protein
MKWLPSRHHFALARLIAVIVCRTGNPACPDGRDPVCPDGRDRLSSNVIYAIDRGQSALENYTVSALIYIVASAYLIAALPWPWWLSAIVVLPLTPLVVQIPIYVSGSLLRGRVHLRFNSIFFMSLLLLASAYFAARPGGWVRWVAWSMLALFALNAIAACVMWLLRGYVAEVERRCAA